MLVDTVRFGTLEVGEEELFDFRAGLPGFPNLRRFFWLRIDGNPVFRWMQAVDDREVAFLLVDPFVFVPGYEVELDDSLCQSMEIERREDVIIFTTVSIPPEGVDMATANLLGPLVFNLKNRFGCQIVIDRADYGVKHPLFQVAGLQRSVVGGK